MFSNPPFEPPIERDPNKFNGRPVIRGTRIPIYQLVEYIDGGYTFQEFGDLFGVDPDLVERAYEQSVREDLVAGKKVPA